MIDIKKPEDVSSATMVAVGLLGGYVAARETGIRPLGGVVLAAAAHWAGRTWVHKTDAPTTALLSTLYFGGFGLSHPLAKKIGPWPSVLTVTAVAASAAYVLADR